jgi:hypothetical protein
MSKEPQNRPLAWILKSLTESGVGYYHGTLTGSLEDLAYKIHVMERSTTATIPPRSKAPFCHCLPTLSCLTHATPHSTFSQLERVEASSSLTSYTISMAENTASTGYPLLTYILNFKWTYKIYASLPHRLIIATFMT